ncbi:signal transduction histidine kinase [Penicillium malachiteum]|uniref:Signal transduction histidine kinase n=1 Tax=Penicillium malachiteum TaxID=1324776 RepID=A0AAD6HTM0_9EURO|nr:signal transduction histidine kinase [Penicillium malachiteum]
MAPVKSDKPEAPPRLEDNSDIIDASTFEQILEMDDDDDRDFSKGIVYGFFDQAKTTFEKMESAVEKKQLDELSSLGHFLKGSSATLGLTNVKDGCEKIQHFGAGKDETGTTTQPDDEISLKNIKTTVDEVKIAYAKVERFLRRYYGEKLPEKEEKEEEVKEEVKETKETTKEEVKETEKEEKKETKEDTKDEEPKKK